MSWQRVHSLRQASKKPFNSEMISGLLQCLKDSTYVLQETGVCIDGNRREKEAFNVPHLELSLGSRSGLPGLGYSCIWFMASRPRDSLHGNTSINDGMKIPLFSLVNKNNARNSSYDNRNSSYVLWTDRAPSVLPCFSSPGRHSSPSPCKFCTVCNRRCEAIHARGSVEILACEIGKVSCILTRASRSP